MVWTGCGFQATGQEFEVLEVNRDAQGELSVTFPAEERFYYLLVRGESLERIVTARDLRLGTNGVGALVDPGAVLLPLSFYKVIRMPLNQPHDSDGDGIDDVTELRFGFLDALNPADAANDFDGDGRSNLEEYRSGTDMATTDPAPLTVVDSTSPDNGETAVAVTRETIFRLSQPLSANAVVGAANLSATFAGQPLLARRHLSTDRRTITFFYQQNLPGSARVRVTFNANSLIDVYGRAVDADGDDHPGGVRLLEFDTQSQSRFPNTTVCGRVFASELAPPTNGVPNPSINVPLAGVIVTADGLEQEVRAVTDTFGNFRLENAPAGPFFVHIDGRTVGDDANGIRYPDLAYYPFVGKLWHSIPGQETNIGEVYLPLVAAGTLQPVSLTSDTVITFPAAVLAEHPELAGVTLTVPANSLFSDNGTRGGMVGIAPVPSARLPSPLPLGLVPPLVFTLQSDGPLNLDRPVPICLPNLPDPTTGQSLPPGAKSALWSFNHDIGEFEIVGPMTVSADGRFVCTDPGVGIPAPGWHFDGSGAPGGGGGGGGPPDDAPPKDDDSGDSGDCPDDESDPTDPVYMFSGEFYDEETDLRIKGIGVDFVWSRKYRSKLGPNTAQGNGWDSSYNLFLQQSGTGITVCNGKGRNDLYQLMPDGTWAFNGFFRELKKNADATHTLTFKNKGAWNFHPFDGSGKAGKVTSIADRNGNTMRFVYDARGRLIQVIDTLDRPIAISYNADGFIQAVTDFAGRSVRYTYYGQNEAGGNFGDLKSVTTPIVVGTPNGNDFPNGKTRTYTYTTGLSDDRLNHNLLTITDGRRNDPNDPTFGSGPYLVNEYATTTNPEATDFDRVLRQIWGGHAIHFTYVPQVPAAENAQATMRTIVNDRVGNVQEYFYDAGNRCVMMREYTGRADPAKPSTDLANRPAGKLRPTDPEYFETRYEYNLDYQRTRTIHPNGNITENVYEADINPSAPARSRGNLRIVRHLPGTHTPVGDQGSLTETYEYTADFGGGCCGGDNFVTRQNGGRGDATTTHYDAMGNRIRIQYAIASIVEEFEYDSRGRMTKRTLPDNGSGSRRTDVFLYYTSGPQRGYLELEIIDAANFALGTTYQYDAVGNVVRKTDPRGNDTQFVVNTLNQIVREISREVTDGSGVRYHKDTFYDANNNIARVDVQNRDETGALQPNSDFTTRYDYELLDQLIRESKEVELNHVAVTEYAYDGNRDRILTRFGEAVNGHQPANTIITSYDERNLVFKVVRGSGAPSQSTTQNDYDGNRNRVKIGEGLEDTPRVTEHAYDSYNRLVRSIDPMGNVSSFSYDADNKRVYERVDGELDDQPGGTRNVRLSATAYTYDALTRLTATTVAFFDTQTQAPIGDGTARTETVYNDASQVLRTIDDNGHEMRTEYDTANRQSLTTDAKGNTVAYEYDANSNLIRVTETEKSDLRNPDQVFVTTVEYDNLNRLTATRNNVDTVTRLAYDSRNNRVRSTDGRGNNTRLAYDGINRLVTAIRDLSDSGGGGGDVAKMIATSQVWDDSSRLIAQVDPNGNATTYVHNALNWKTAIVHADGTAKRMEFDAHGNVIRTIDGNETVVICAYDLLNRVTRKDVAPGPRVSDDTSFEKYKYDGLSRVSVAENDASVVARTYNSLSQITVERLTIDKGDPMQTTATTASESDAKGNPLVCVYPSGRRITCTYDELDRKKVLSDATGGIATFFYVGAGRVERQDFANGTRCDYVYNGSLGVPNSPLDFGSKKITRTTHSRVVDGSIIDDRAYAWDRASNKTERKDIRVHGGQLAYSYSYDSADRLIRSTVVSPVQVTETIDYAYDGAGNRTSVTGGSNDGTYTLQATQPDPVDLQVNQYTTTPIDSRSYDANGNLVSTDSVPHGHRSMKYNYRDQMIELNDAASNRRYRYTYDALGRRIAKAVDPSVGAAEQRTRFFYRGWQVVEEQNETGIVTGTYVYGSYIDELLEFQRGTSRYYAHSDDLFSVIAITDIGGLIVERLDYKDFGEPIIRNAAQEPVAESVVGNVRLFTGREFDYGTGFYDYRTRYLDVKTGRFLTRDTIGIWGDMVNVGNPFTYVGNSPSNRLDPSGSIGCSLPGACVVCNENCQKVPAGLEDFAPIFRGCVAKHEQCHIQQVQSANPDWCTKGECGECADAGTELSWTDIPGYTSVSGECECFLVTYNCLKSKYAATGDASYRLEANKVRMFNICNKCPLLCPPEVMP